MKDKLRFRSATLKARGNGPSGPSTIDLDGRSVEVVVATEAPVPFWGVDEILRMDGAVLPANGQLPLLNTHDRFDTRSVWGSVRELSVKKDKLIGRAYFATGRDPNEALAKVADGHLTDISVGYQIEKFQDIDRDQESVVAGQTYKGPVRVVTKWEPKEASLAPIGADQAAKIRADTNGGHSMGNPVQPQETPEQRAAGEEQQRILDIQTMCRNFGMNHLVDCFIHEGVSVESASRQVLDGLAQREGPGSSGVFRSEFGASAEEKRRAATVDGQLVRMGVIKPDEAAPGAREFASQPLLTLAQDSLRAAGKSTKNLTPREIIDRAMVTGDFPYILGEIPNKSMQIGYQEAASTWQRWAKPGTVQDFKTNTRPQISEFPDLDEMAEHQEYRYANISEFAEEYSILTYGKLFAITRQAIINDDQSAFGSLPRGQGQAAARKVNSLVYSVLTANAAMNDGITLFHASHSNVGTAGAPGEDTLAEGLKLMRQQTGPGGSVLGVQPRYIISPAALEIYWLKVLTESIPGGKNIFADMFELVVEPVLDLTSEIAWYVAAGNVDTVEVGFLNGQQSPYLESRQGWSVDGVEYKVRIDCGAKALDHRGLLYNAGA